MYKLLAKANREKVVREYSLRRASVMLALLALLALFALLSLLPSLILTRGMKDSALYLKETAESLAESPDKAVLDAWAKEMRGKLAILSSDLEPDRSYEYFQMVLGAKTAGVRITGLSFDKSKKGGNITVRGIADSRQELIRFEDSLKSSQSWSKVDLPVNALAQDAGAKFEIFLTPEPATRPDHE